MASVRRVRLRCTRRRIGWNPRDKPRQRPADDAPHARGAAPAPGADVTVQPYYEQSGVTIYHGDSLEILPTLGPVDLVLTDPPYGIGLVTKTSDYRGSANFDRGASLQASVLYKDSPAEIRQLIADVIPLAQRLTDRLMIFCGPSMLWAYPE